MLAYEHQKGLIVLFCGCWWFCMWFFLAEVTQWILEWIRFAVSSLWYLSCSSKTSTLGPQYGAGTGVMWGMLGRSNPSKQANSDCQYKHSWVWNKMCAQLLLTKMAVLKHMKVSVAQLSVSNSGCNCVCQEGEEQGRNIVLFLNTRCEACNLILCYVKALVCVQHWSTYTVANP